MMQNLTVDEASAFISLVYDSSLEKNQWSSPVGQLFALCPGHVAAVVTFEDAKWVSSHVPVLPGGEHGAQITELMDDVEAGEVSQPDDLKNTLFAASRWSLGRFTPRGGCLAKKSFATRSRRCTRRLA